MVTPTPGPPPQPIGAGERAKPYNPPSAEILTAPYGQTSDVTSRPFQDPAQDKATYARIYQLLQDLNAFHDFELGKLEDTSDPAISLPLNTFRGDRQRLMDEVAFLNRNPGLQSTLTVGDVQGIRVNLTYLQKKARALHGGVIDLSADLRIEGFESGSAVPSKATADELKDASFRIAIEIARLQGSGTTDPVYQVRINVLTKIKQSVDTIVNQLNAKTLLPEDVPITSKDLKDFLPTISNPASPVTRFLDKMSAPGVKNLFPAYEGADISGAQLANALFQKYGDSLMKGTTWDLSVHYEDPSAKAKASASASASATKRTRQNPSGQFELGMVSRGRGDFDRAFGELETSSSGPGVRPVLPTPNTASFDWKARSAQICEAVRQQGLDPADFGCLANTSKVGEDFSWRGYAKMVCTRLQTTTDTGLPEACGCPPVGWPGWRQ